MLSKKVLKLLPYPGVHSCCYYHFEEEEVVKARSLPRAVTELGGFGLLTVCNKTDVVFSSSEAEGL